MRENKSCSLKQTFLMFAVVWPTQSRDIVWKLKCGGFAVPNFIWNQVRAKFGDGWAKICRFMPFMRRRASLASFPAIRAYSPVTDNINSEDSLSLASEERKEEAPTYSADSRTGYVGPSSLRIHPVTVGCEISGFHNSVNLAISAQSQHAQEEPE